MREWWEERTIGQKILVVLGFVVLGAGLALLFGFVVLWLWNWLMPTIFGLPEITYWQAWGLLCLSWIFFHRFDSKDSDSSDRKRKRKLREYMETETDDTSTDAAADRLSPAETQSSDDVTPEQER